MFRSFMRVHRSFRSTQVLTAPLLLTPTHASTSHAAANLAKNIAMWILNVTHAYTCSSSTDLVSSKNRCPRAYIQCRSHLIHTLQFVLHIHYNGFAISHNKCYRMCTERPTRRSCSPPRNRRKTISARRNNSLDGFTGMLGEHSSKTLHTHSCGTHALLYTRIAIEDG